MDRARKNQDSYDRVADRYFERNRDRSLLRPWMQRFKDYLPADTPVLDLGAGPCLDSAELRSLGLRVISVDRSWRMLMAAHEEIPGLRAPECTREAGGGPARRSRTAAMAGN
jgi:SAM-dependent methyltransferase